MSRFIPRTLAESRNLREYRDYVLGKSQSDIANHCGCCQAWVSQVERGHLPRKKKWGLMLEAYQLSEAEFVRLVLGGAPDLPSTEFAADSTPKDAQEPLKRRLNTSNGKMKLIWSDVAREVFQLNAGLVEGRENDQQLYAALSRMKDVCEKGLAERVGTHGSRTTALEKGTGHPALEH